MAFNPFHTFRKHQKKAMAALAIGCMFVFVLSGSMTVGWDYFMEVARFFGVSSSNKPTVATLYGRNVDQDEIKHLRGQRQMANRFMGYANSYAMNNAYRHLMELRQTAATKFPDLQEKLQKFGNIMPGTPQFQALMGFIHGQLKEEGKNDEAALLSQMIEKNQIMVRLQKHGFSTFYFGGSAKQDTPELLDFMIWQHQADRLGIRLTEKDINELINGATEQLLSAEDFQGVEQNLNQQFGKYTPSELVIALRDEFRVNIAQQLLVGYGPDVGNPEQDAFGLGAQQPPRVREPVTPYEFWQYYQTNLTRANLVVLPIPVRASEFLSQVGQPNEQDILDLYNKAKDKDYDPMSPTAGFKQPPRVQIEWVTGRPDSPYFSHQAANLKFASWVAQQVAYASQPLPTQTALAAAVNLKGVTEYERRKKAEYSQPWTAPSLPLMIFSGLERPENVASTVGLALGSAASQGPGALAGLVGYQQDAVVRPDRDVEAVLAQENQRRTRFGLGLVLAGASPVPLSPATVAAYAVVDNQYLPYDLVKSHLNQKSQEELAQDLAKKARTDLKDELEKWSKVASGGEAVQALKTDRVEKIATTLGLAGALAGSGVSGLPAPAFLSAGMVDKTLTQDKAYEAAKTMMAGMATQAVLCGTGTLPLSIAALVSTEKELPHMLARASLEKALKTKGMEHGISGLRDAYDVAQDPGLDPLKKRANATPDNPAGDSTGRQFSQQLFGYQGAPNETRLYVPQEMNALQDTYLYWNTAYEPAYVPTLAQVRDRVIQRWELEKARPLAQKAAEDLAAAAHKAGDPERNLLDNGAPRFGTSIFDLVNVAPIAVSGPQPVENSSTYRQYQRYTIPADKKDKIEFSDAKVGQQIVDKLLSLREKGDTTVFSDQPEATYFVAALPRDRVKPEGVSFFYEDFADPTIRNQLLTFLEQDDHFLERHRQAVVERLRQEAKLDLNKEMVEKLAPHTLGE